MVYTGKLLFGGLDVALRIDNTSFCSLQLDLKTGILEQYGLVVWPHIHPKEIGENLAAINTEDRHTIIGYDRLGTGELIKLFPNKIIGIMQEIISSMPGKQDIIGLLKSLWDAQKLIIHDDRLYTEISEQEKYISDAGNILYRHPEGFHDDRFWSLGYAAKAAVEYMKKSSSIKVGIVSTKKMEGQITEDMLNHI
jgi:hypothetical protein